MIKTLGGLRQTSRDYRKYLLTFQSRWKIFGSSSEIIGSLSTLKKNKLYTLRTGDLRSTFVLYIINEIISPFRLIASPQIIAPFWSEGKKIIVPDYYYSRKYGN